MSTVSYLVTGGTGTFGRAFVGAVLAHADTARVIVFSRDELKQSEMRREIQDRRLEFFVGDVRDRDRLLMAFDAKLDVIVHAAAMKQVPACEANPFEALATNVLGAKHVIEAAIARRIPRVLAMSSDKACGALNLYGRTKALAESLFVRGNGYAGAGPTRFCTVRYGNVIGSRGSVLPVWMEQARRGGPLTLTDRRMTRFWLSIEEGVDFVLRCLERMQGGEVFIPKMISASLVDMATAIGPTCAIAETGIRPGEKLHEQLVSVDEAPCTYELEDAFMIAPANPSWPFTVPSEARPVAADFTYSSEQHVRPVSVSRESAPCA